MNKPFGEHDAVHQRKIILLLVVCILCWSASFTGIKIGLEGFSAFSLALLRYLFASIALLLYAYISKMPLPKVSDIPAFFLMGFLSFSFYNVALNLGQTTTPASTASIIIALIPIFVSILAYIFLGEKLGRWNVLGVLLAFIGVSVATSKGGFAHFEVSAGVIWLICAAISAAISTILQKSYLSRYSGSQVMSYSIWCGTIILLIFTPKLLNELPTAPVTSVLAALWLGIFPGVIAYIAWGWILKIIPASQAETYLYLDTVGAIFIAWAVLGEVPGINVFIGFGLIIVGLVLVSRR